MFSKFRNEMRDFFTCFADRMLHDRFNINIPIFCLIGRFNGFLINTSFYSTCHRRPYFRFLLELAHKLFPLITGANPLSISL